MLTATTTTPVAVYRFFRGDTLLGTVVQSFREAEAGWCGGYFEPSAEFERVRPLFDNELHLLNTSRRGEWREMWEEIQRPGLRLEPLSGGATLAGFTIHIEQDRAWWR
jgi:hypothetical protein